jgi:hypothetical protein
VRKNAPFQYPRSLQPFQTLHEQRARDMRETALEFVEVVNIGEQFTDD